MTRKENAKKNIKLTFDFIRQVIDDPKILDKIPNGSVLEFVEKMPEEKPKAGLATSERHKSQKRKFLKVTSHFDVME
jgi:hypothetical protein